ncbi:hypothetical protein JQU17_02535 [Ponticoccus sp. SC2-23]|uniref:hypothetical protein n=1 Tax=Alexandriicola marinus TaxID=2081710 RepID=UPI000FDC9608|nr:hypothetical protein [Alexandriicola marinus]MBM1219060.1 hypothetical protein [Ponticoccus sp. SC6-9]MBM1223868.1 hypothetical protein [Ponticoccus sp. SC6-15]MBM1228874.1 hypothetical protein [Ponticoccus sp. SC6-38]MBM1232834.1 hypothetical protein [Ponticoccus sp. SC6-45]MBM1237216.1 hypothetical protein [Ponticoccus sp. SC6-49]MBM1241845.1 hypothetical protein [Ponticoccus sp. SC2-64]MBM1246358.1 hypothetical protein [Ponticoccus sp. SC6-42]MBM1250836.1 hypothetical protein [Pontico
MADRRDFFNVRHPFFLPVGRRLAVVVVTGGWAMLELASGNAGWAMIFGAAAAWCGYEFFVVFDPENYKEKKDD